MHWIKSHKVSVFLLAASMAIATAAMVRAADSPTTKPAKVKVAKLVKPWSDLKSLSDDQKSKINDLHAKASADIKAIRDKEETDIMALLSDEQKTELKTNEEKAKADDKAKRAEAMGHESDAPKKD
jgi:Spy/CpxP family protein refolding chaperone